MSGVYSGFINPPRTRFPLYHFMSGVYSGFINPPSTRFSLYHFMSSVYSGFINPPSTRFSCIILCLVFIADPGIFISLAKNHDCSLEILF